MSLYFSEFNILSDYQCGFSPGRSTQQAGFDLLKYIYSGLNHKKVIASVCLDVVKAFDCINHDILLFNPLDPNPAIAAHAVLPQSGHSRLGK